MLESVSLSDSSFSSSETGKKPLFRRRVKGRKKLNDKESGFDYWQEGDKYEYKEY